MDEASRRNDNNKSHLSKDAIDGTTVLVVNDFQRYHTIKLR